MRTIIGLVIFALVISALLSSALLVDADAGCWRPIDKESRGIDIGFRVVLIKELERVDMNRWFLKYVLRCAIS